MKDNVKSIREVFEILTIFWPLVNFTIMYIVQKLQRVAAVIFRRLKLNSVLLTLQLVWIFAVFFFILFSTHPGNNPEIPFVPKPAVPTPAYSPTVTNDLAPRMRPGEMGKPVYLDNATIDKQKGLIEELKNKFGFNQYVSNQISVRRSIPDYR